MAKAMTGDEMREALMLSAKRAMLILPADVSRCVGHTVGGTSQLRLECMDCLRRTAPRAEQVVMTEPPAEHPCPMRIAEGERE